MQVAVALLAAYVLGSVPFGYLITRARGMDIRQVGSGNIGASNVYRALGPVGFGAVLVTDVAKGAAGAFLASRLSGLDPAWGGVLGGLATVLGHNWSVFLRFRGGKGAAASAGVLLYLAPLAGLAAFAVYGITVWRTRLASLGSFLGAAAVVLVLFLAPHPAAIRWFGVVAVVFLVYRHRANLRRLMRRQELRMEYSKQDRE
ncbi:hypothetical protein SY88_08670 [Clostridiales bacterium PH28_bin88]|nr:hypothetical protein SY88_08670 [Clostridiales bacterium PH28_bin88]